MTDSLPSTLDDIRVLDLAGEAGAYCGKMLADMGADVIKVEPPGGDPARRIGPFYHGDVHPERSLCFFANNTSKRSVTLDITSSDGRDILHRLVATADVLIESFSPGYLDELGVGYGILKLLHPRLVYCSVTGFGVWGPHSTYQWSDLTVVAMSGMMYLAGYPDQPPDRPYGNQSHYCASIQAANGIITALLSRDVTGEGQMVEVSAQEALSMNQETSMQMWDLRQEVRKRIGDEHPMPGRGTYECADGYVYLMLSRPASAAPLLGLLRWMDEEGMAADLLSDEWKDAIAEIDLELVTRTSQMPPDDAFARQWRDRFKRLDEVIGRFLRIKSKRELHEVGHQRGLMIAPLNSPKNIAQDDHLNARQWFSFVEHSELGQVLRYPGPPYRLSETPWRISRRPPLIGEHNREVYVGELGLTDEEMTALIGAGVI